jgi:hypothetical protein
MSTRNTCKYNRRKSIYLLSKSRRAHYHDRSAAPHKSLQNLHLIAV